MSGCELFFTTPFPDELTALDAYHDLKDIIPDVYQPEYRMKVIKNLLCLSVSGAGTQSHAYLFNTTDLSFILDSEGSFNTLFMADAVTGNIIMGDQVFTPDLEYTGVFTLFESYYFGFSYGNFNYSLKLDSDRLEMNVFNSDWSSNSNSTNVALDTMNQLRSAFFSYSDANLASPVLILQLRNDYDKSKVLKVSLAGLNNNPLKLTGTYPYNQEGFYLPPADGDDYFFVDTGYVYKGRGAYYYESYSGETKSLDYNYDTKEWILTFDQEGHYYFMYNKNTKKLYKYQVWW